MLILPKPIRSCQQCLRRAETVLAWLCFIAVVLIADNGDNTGASQVEIEEIHFGDRKGACELARKDFL